MGICLSKGKSPMSEISCLSKASLGCQGMAPLVLTVALVKETDSETQNCQFI